MAYVENQIKATGSFTLYKWTLAPGYVGWTRCAECGAALHALSIFDTELTEVCRTHGVPGSAAEFVWTWPGPDLIATQRRAD